MTYKEKASYGSLPCSREIYKNKWKSTGTQNNLAQNTNVARHTHMDESCHMCDICVDWTTCIIMLGRASLHTNTKLCVSHTHAQTHAHTRAQKLTQIHTLTHTHTHTYTHKLTRTRAPQYIHIDPSTNIHKCTHTPIQNPRTHPPTNS